MRAAIASARAGGVGRFTAFRPSAKGTPLWWEVVVTPICDAEGKPERLLAVSRDITALGELDRLKDQFIAVAAHELKTPVAIMKGYAQILPRTLREVSPQTQRMLEAIDHGAGRIDRVVGDLLDISKLQTGVLELFPERVDLAALVDDVVDRLSLGTSQHQLKVTHLDRIVVEADRDRLEQVLAILLDNAIRYAPDGGEVDVRCGLGLRRSRSACVTTVLASLKASSNVSSNASTAPTPAPPTTTAAWAWASISLTRSSSATVGRCGSRAKNDWGAFSTSACPWVATVAARTPTVLVVDDDPYLAEMVTFALAEQGFTVLTAGDGQEALSCVARQMPALILLDMKMPVMDGWTFAREFHSRYDQQAPILIFTAAADAKQRAQEVGAAGYVGKPFDVVDLVARIRRHVGQGEDDQ